MKTFYIQTYGCQMNYSDSERVRNVLEGMGLHAAQDMDEADVIIFNTCSVRQKAEDKVFGQLQKLAQERKRREGLKIGITGCMARVASTRNSMERDKLLKQIDELDFIFPIRELTKLPELLGELGIEGAASGEGERAHVSSLDNYFQINTKTDTTFQRYLPIMTGCDKFCSYCIVPYARGREKSRPLLEVLAEAEKMVENGAVEITVLGQNVNSYGVTVADKKTDLFDYSNIEGNPPFVQLLKRLDELKAKGLKRLRFTSSNPWNFSDALIYAIRDLETMMPYVHLPLQSGSDTVLERMNRSHTREHYLSKVSLLRREVPGCCVSTDLIVGFCGETEAEFMETYNLYKEIAWDMAYIAQYSPRRGTYAEKTMKDDVEREEKSRRWHMLNDLLRETGLKKNQEMVGKTAPVLFEKCENGVNKGRTDTYKEVYVPGGHDLKGQITDVKIRAAKEWILMGEAV